MQVASKNNDANLNQRLTLIFELKEVGKVFRLSGRGSVMTN